MTQLETKGYFINKDGEDSRNMKVSLKKAEELAKKGIFVPSEKSVVKPKKVCSAYMFFNAHYGKELRSKDPSLKITEV